MKKGFTLVELSISLVIIALIAGSVLAAQELIEQSNRRKFLKELSDYITAINSFEEKYDGLPGDITNAKTIWTSCTDNPPNNYCNGDGNGNYDAEFEGLRAWEQLNWAEFTNFKPECPDLLTYSFCSPTYSRRYVAGVNVPKTILTDESAYKIENRSGQGDVIRLGSSYDSSTGFELRGATISPQDAWEFDLKIDDGIAGTGEMQTTQGTLGGSGAGFCSDNSDAGDYHQDVSDIRCISFFSIK